MTEERLTNLIAGQGIAYFALDIGLSLYRDAVPSAAEHMHSLATHIVERAGFDPNPEKLLDAIAALDQPDQKFLVKWVNFGSFTGTSRSASLHLLEGALDWEWIRSVGFEGRPLAIATLGQELVASFSDVTEAHNARFCEIDETCETLLEQSVSARDQRILTQMLKPSTVEDALGYLMYYILAEDIRARLAALSLEPAIVEVLEDRMNTRLAQGGPGAQTVSWSEALV